MHPQGGGNGYRHTPHNSIVAKYAVKGLNGFRHSYAFTTGNFVEPILITIRRTVM